GWVSWALFAREWQESLPPAAPYADTPGVPGLVGGQLVADALDLPAPGGGQEPGADETARDARQPGPDRVRAERLAGGGLGAEGRVDECGVPYGVAAGLGGGHAFVSLGAGPGQLALTAADAGPVCAGRVAVRAAVPQLALAGAHDAASVKGCMCGR